jgi:hypothetical protein
MAYIMDTNEEERVKVRFCDNCVSVEPDFFYSIFVNAASISIILMFICMQNWF